MSGTLALLISLVIAIEVAIPVGTFLLFKGRYDDKTRLWFISVICASASIILVALRPFLPEYLSYQIPWIFMVGGFLLMIEAISRELRPGGSWKAYWLAFILWIVLVYIIYILGLSTSLGFVAYSLCLALLAFILLVQIWKIHKQHPSKSLRILQIGFLFYSLPALARVFAYLSTGSVEQLDVFKFNPVTNVLVFTYVLAALFVPFGYWGFTLEKSERERDRAKAGEDKATQEADRFRQLVEERDRLLVMNSRFSTVSALSSFSAMLIHDITQPLQTLQLGLERIRSNLVSGSSRDQLERDVLHLESTMDRAGELVVALRRLMQSGEAVVKPVAVVPLFKEVDSILSSEALKRRVKIALHNDLPPECSVKADATMLQRIVINLISNALNQFRSTGTKRPQVDIRLVEEIRHNESFVVVEVTDNGGGFRSEVLERVGLPWSSERQGGLGLALMLTKQLMGIWGGQLEICNRTDGVAGAMVRIALPKAS
ncbi:MAG: Sensor protein FixL [Pseudomonadota bacterium]